MKLPFGYIPGDGTTGISEGTLGEILNDSPRGSVLVTAAALEMAITLAIKARLVDDGQLLDRLFQSDGPLGSFGAKIMIARALNYLSTEAYKDALIIKAIRNEFAHRMQFASFDTDSVRDRCSNLQLPDMYYGHLSTDDDIWPKRTDLPGSRQYGVTDAARKLRDARSRFIASSLLISGAFSRSIRPETSLPFI